MLLLSTITALGPLIVFLMQMIEGRVSFSEFTLAGLLIYSSGVLLTIPSLITGHRPNTSDHPISPGSNRVSRSHPP